jgi:predicted RNA-binding protein
MYFKCDSASCYARSQRLKDECIETVEEAIAEKKEEKAQKKREEEEKRPDVMRWIM